MANNLTCFGQFLLVLDEWMTVKFEHWVSRHFVIVGCHCILIFSRLLPRVTLFKDVRVKFF